MTEPGDPEGSAPRLAVVSVRYHSEESCRDHLASWYEALDLVPPGSVDVVLWDNSAHEEAPRVVSHDPAVRVVASDNIGFAAGCNAGAGATTAPWLLFLNPDVRVGPEFFRDVLSVLAAPTTPDFVAMSLDTPHGGHGSVHLWPWLATMDGSGVRARFGSRPVGPTGAAMICRRTAFDAVGRFDEDYFAWGEDVELMVRARLAGCRTGRCGGLVAWHDGGHSLAGDAARIQRKNGLLNRNRTLLVTTYLSRTGLIIWSPFLAASFGFYLLRAVQRRTVRATLRGMRDGFRAGRVRRRTASTMSGVDLARGRGAWQAPVIIEPRVS